jgi:drug/metabolite transporter (DMT)-like permease
MIRLKVLLAVLIWGASFVFTKRALAEVSPWALVMARCGLGSAAMLLLARAPCGKEHILPHGAWRSNIRQAPGLFKGLRPKEWLQLAGISLCGVVGQQVIQAFALRRTSANHAGVGLIPTGRGDTLIFASCFNWALYVVMMDRWLRSRTLRAVTVMSMAAGFAITAAACAAGGQWRELAHVSAMGWLCLGYLGILSSGVGYLLWNAGVEEIGPSATSAFLYLEPLTALVSGRLALGEGIAPTAVLGGAMILAGVYRVNSGRKLPAVPEEGA